MEQAKNNTIYTIGYTSFALDDFMDVLNNYHINCLIDVRSFPYSGYYKEYDKDYLEIKLKNVGKYYRNYAKEFGARQEEKIFLADKGYLDFEKFTISEQFKEGILKLRNSSDKGYNIVLMCAEKDPITCHRSVMIGRALKDNSFDVEHILANKKLESQSKLEDRIIYDFCKKHKINRSQFSLLDDALENLSDQEVLALAYRERNAEIGYRRGEE